MTDNSRPASFDARVMAYLPGLRKLAARRVQPAYRDDLVTDTIAYALEHWTNYREDGGLWNWLVWQMRGILKNEATKKANRDKHVTFVQMADHMHFSVPASQEDYADLSFAFDRAAGVKNGDVLIRRAMGDTLDDIATDRGLCRERIRQLESAARAELRAAA